MKKIIQSLFFCLLIITVGCKKDNDTNNNNTTTTGGGNASNYLLVIENGAEVVKPNETITMKAFVVDDKGVRNTPATVSWKVLDENFASVTNGVISAKSVGITVVECTATFNGVTLTASVPLKVALNELFVVLPQGIIFMAGDKIQLNPVYMTNETITYTYTSNGTSVATVNSSGEVTAVGQGSTFISVKASNGNEVIVPVLVVAMPKVVLPVVKVVVNPATADIFRGDNTTFTAKAYNSDNQEVSGKTITWQSLDPTIATIDNNGKVTGVEPGVAKIQAIIEGITGTAEVTVNPDTAVIVTPFYTVIPQGGTQQFVAKAYLAKTWTDITSSVASKIKWEMPQYPAGFEMFNIGSVDNTGKVTIKADAMVYMTSIVIAGVQGSPYAVGGASITVGEKTNCGDGNASVKTIKSTDGNDITLSLMAGQKTLKVEALDASNNAVSNPKLKFNSGDKAVVIVDEDSGEMSPMGPGETTITICSGTYANLKVKITVGF